MEAERSDITEEEFAQYDRQIRLWGLDAQRRLRHAKVLIVGMGGLASEVVKNVVLAGVKAITLLDDKVVTEKDMENQLLVTHFDKGKNRAEASKQRTQELNPNVIVSVDTTSVYYKKDTFFKEFNIVCLTGVALELRLKINHICRMEGIKFFCGDVFGFYGYCFADLGMHEFAKEEEKKKEIDITDDDEPGAKKQKQNNDRVVDQQEEKVLIKATDEFCSLEESYSEDWSKRSRKIIKRSSCIFFIIQVIDRFKKATNRLPLRTEEDKNLLSKLREEVLREASVPESFIPEEFTQFCVSELSPVCAITGGILGQEIIKTASQRDSPHNNYFFFDGRSHSGIVDQICPPYV